MTPTGNNTRPRLLAVLTMLGFAASVSAEDAPPDFVRDVKPILTKYCAGCHNADDRDGELSVESYADLQQGGENGPAVLPGQGAGSRLIRVITGEIEPKMPPEDSDAPTDAQVAVLKAWIDGGAIGPEGQEPDRTVLIVPEIDPSTVQPRAVTAADWSGELLAVARSHEVELLDSKLKHVGVLRGHAGKVNSVEFANNGKWLVTASGVTGLYGEAVIWDVGTHRPYKTIKGHRDILYDATVSPDGKLLATAGYDKVITLWSVSSGKRLKTFTGHNGAVFDLAFSPDGALLASASADETCKIWHVDSGRRFDTLGQPLKEQFAVAFSPDGKHIAAGGGDNRIRVWRLVSRKKPRINPILFARFAHEGPIVGLEYTADGERLISVAEDRMIKLHETRTYTQIHNYEEQPDVASALAVAPDGGSLLVGRMDGTLRTYPVLDAATKQRRVNSVAVSQADMGELQEYVEQEPNDYPTQASPIALPAQVKGVINAQGRTDADLYRFSSKAGQQWMLEINAARSKSKLDSKIEVLDDQGDRVPRVVLQAVRDSYFTFRGKNSDTIDDFRVHNWREMELNEYLYANGEVAKLWLYPRGPDSGFKVYPGRGKRWGYFGTAPISHPLHEPCYIVKPLAPGTPTTPNGLPVFTVNYENDDDSLRELGVDSRLLFTAPRDGDYLVRVTDVRSFQGQDHHYTLTVRPRRPDFAVNVANKNPKVSAGSGKQFAVDLKRIDGFDGEVRVDVTNVPPGFHVSTPIVIQEGQNQALGVLNALPDAPMPTEEQSTASTVTATAVINGKSVTKTVGNLGKITLDKNPTMLVRILPDASESTHFVSPDKPLELVIAPGETITARVAVERAGHKGPISFGKEDSGRNLPHGVYVDNIGLNGLLIVPSQNERKFFLTAAPWVPEQTRLFFLTAAAKGNQSSWPVILHVRRLKQLASQ